MSTSRATYRPDLEALRGLAVLLVVAYHAGVPALAGGFVGVDVFFVLSGFFTARLLVREYATTGTVDLAAFYAKRALRLLPALLVVVLATLAAAWAVYAPIDRAAIADTARAVASGVSNAAFARDAVNYFAGARSPFLHTWSLAVELQVSLFGPPLFLALAASGGVGAARAAADPQGRRVSALLRGVGVGLAAVGALSLGTAVWLTAASPSWAFFGAWSRAWEFVAGALLALALPADAAPETVAVNERGAGWWLQGAGLVAVAVAALVYDRATPYPGTAALLPVLGAVAVVAGGARGRRPLASGAVARMLAWFGAISYSWYLWHWPIIVIASVLFPSMGVAGRLLWSVGALAPAWITLRLVERPLRAPRAEGHGRGWWPAVALAGCALVASGAGAARRAAEARVAAPDQRAFAAARDDRMPHACWAGPQRSAPPGAGCVFGDPSATTTIALFGDSHAEHWLAAFDSLGRARGWRVVAMVMGGCPVSDAPELARPGDRRGRECARYREAAVRQLIALRPTVAVLSSFDEYVARDGPVGDDRATSRGVSRAAWGRGLRRTYGRLAGAGVPVVAIRGTPRPGFDAPACLSRRAAGLPLAERCTYDLETALHGPARAAQRAAVEDAAARGLPVAMLDLTDHVCAASPCAVVRDGVIVFTDDNHLTASFTRASAGVVGERLDRALVSMRVRLP